MKIKHIERNNFYDGEGYEFIFQLFYQAKVEKNKLVSDLKRYVLSNLSKNIYHFHSKKVLTATHTNGDDYFHEELEEIFEQIERLTFSEELIFENCYLYSASISLYDFDDRILFKEN